MTVLKDLKQVFHSFWYKEELTCAVCGERSGPICPSCEKEYFHPELARCQMCGKLIQRARVLCRDCQEGKGPQGLAKVAAWGHYTGAWKDFIWTVKFRSEPLRLKAISRPFADFAIRNLPVPDGIIPVPIHITRRIERGFNQAEAITSLLHWELGLPIIPGLERHILTQPQTKLTRQERLHNLEGAFLIPEKQLAKKLEGMELWLVDDVITTGATLEACARVLLESGAKKVYGLCLAAGLEKILESGNE